MEADDSVVNSGESDNPWDECLLEDVDKYIISEHQEKQNSLCCLRLDEKRFAWFLDNRFYSVLFYVKSSIRPISLFSPTSSICLYKEKRCQSQTQTKENTPATHDQLTNPTQNQEPRYPTTRERQQKHSSDAFYKHSWLSMYQNTADGHQIQYSKCLKRQSRLSVHESMGSHQRLEETIQNQQLIYSKTILILTLGVVLGSLLDSLSSRLPIADANLVQDMYRKWLHTGDNTIKAAKPGDFYKEKAMTANTFDIEIFVDNLTLEIKVDGKRVMYKYNETIRASPTTLRHTHRGVGMVVLHSTTGEVLIKGHYQTDQPMSYKSFLEMLNNLQAGRILILAAPGDWRSHIPEEAVFLLQDYLDGWIMGEMCIGEMWAGVGLIDGPLWAEAGTTRAIFNGTYHISTPLHIAVMVPKMPDKPRCEWYTFTNQTNRAKFCETYEGYGEFCSCNTTDIITPENAPPLEMKEPIPIVIATSRHQHKVLRQLTQLWSQAGGGNTSLLISVDGMQQEVQDFVEIMGLQAIYHHNPAALKTLGRISLHIKFSIYHAFRLNPQANKLIVLEDDLMVSPDFISYFHQTAPLLDADKTIFCINAYNYNSFLPTAIDTSRLYREEVLPAYGWMITREMAEELMPEWPGMTAIADWDWYMRGVLQRGRAIITPEVPRTYHNGYGGFHVTGWEQSAYFDRRPLNVDPDAKVNISYLTHDAYEAFLESELQNATVLEIKEHPCHKEYIPKEKVGSFVIYFHGDYETDEHTAYYTLVACLNGYERGRMEHHRLMYTLGYYGNALYVIACPGSYYCRVKEDDYDRLVYNPKPEDLVTSIKYKQKHVKHMTTIEGYFRIKAVNLWEEVLMQNAMIYKTSVIMAEVGEDGKLAM